ncbi:MAG TPA: ERF family protein [Noviherbaspirillum sp.]|nr:ERF family protein [Noviherbaspirillum sp.]
MRTEVSTIEQGQRGIVAQTPATPADMVLYVMQNGGSIDQLEKFMALQSKWEADQARKAYVADMAEFKKNPPQIVKDKLVSFSGTSYTHATLGNVTNAIVEGLAAHGFSHRWDVKQNGTMIEVGCTITHRMGHAETVTMQAGKDDSGKKNAIQQVASAVTYLQRYTLLAATGLATHEQVDDDGRAAETDTALADKWIAKARAAKDSNELQAVWKGAIAEIRAVDDRHAYDEVKAAVVARKNELEGAK